MRIAASTTQERIAELRPHLVSLMRLLPYCEVEPVTYEQFRVNLGRLLARLPELLSMKAMQVSSSQHNKDSAVILPVDENIRSPDAELVFKGVKRLKRKQC